MQPRPPSPAPPRTAGIAIASLVLALSGILCIFTPIAGLISGILALLKINRSQGALAGRGFAIAGIVISAFLMLITPTLVLPAMSRAAEKARRIKCVNNLKTISIAAHTFARTNEMRLPQSFAALHTHLGSPRFLACPLSGITIMESRFDQFDDAKVSYQIIAPGAKADDGETIYIQCPHCGNMALADGTVQLQTAPPWQPPPTP